MDIVSYIFLTFSGYLFPLNNCLTTGNSLGQSGHVSSLLEFVGLLVSEGPSSLLVSVPRTFVCPLCSV